MVTALLDTAERVWPVLLFLVLIQVVADLCDDAGLFDVSAHVAARISGGSRLTLFLLFSAMATLCTWLLSIDTTAVLLAPIGLALAAELGISALPFAFASIWLANAASLLLPVSNLTNLLAQERLGLDAHEFLRATWVPQFAILVVVMAVLLVRHRRAITGSYVVPRTLPPYDPVLLWTAAVVVALIGPAVVVGTPAWVVALGAGVVLTIAFSVRRPQQVAPGRLLRLVPWGVLLFAIALFAVVDIVVVEGAPLLESLFGTGSSLGDLSRLAGVSAVSANAINNLPAYLVAEPFADSLVRVVVVLVAVNVGPMLLAWGSLANLLWLRACRARGLEISLVRFGLEGLLVVPFALAAGVLAAYVTG
ncbi:SLC13 family permease [Nocardioides sp. InS609-2]|uniref:SLC13 family permease n=1 Tax=Nocardioides sp. InS609-2 TaxID=2760705 RepID=UPI0020165CC8|nr:SLC13 family permease [Nocardioides sp. InS609-2]